MTLLPALSILTDKIIPLIAALLGFGILITVHEFGHFIFARAFGIRVPSFSIGMGPVLFKREIWGTHFCLSLLPIGGYVEIAGLAEVGQGDQAHAQVTGPQSFGEKPFWQKLLVQFGGIMFNLGFAYLIYFFLFVAGMPSARLNNLTILGIEQGSPASRSTLAISDTIVGINGKTFASHDHFAYEDFKNEMANRSEVTLEVMRNQVSQNVKVLLEEPKKAGGARLGITFKPDYSYSDEKGLSIKDAVVKSYQVTMSQVQSITYAIKTMFTQKSLKGAGGPVMILNETFRMAQAGIKMLLIFLAFISTNLALLNLLPLGALDGGQILFTVIEFIIRREVPDVVRLAVNLSSWAFFIGIALYLTYHDIIRLFWH